MHMQQGLRTPGTNISSNGMPSSSSYAARYRNVGFVGEENSSAAALYEFSMRVVEM